MNQRDHEIIQKLLNQDEEGMQLLLKEYGGLIKAVSIKQLHYFDRYLDECINDCLLAIWQNIGQYDASKNSFKNWLAVIAKYKAINIIRKYQKEQNNTSIAHIEETMFIEQNKSLHDELWKDLIRDLSIEDQELMSMIYIDGYSPNEIAMAKNMKTSNIYNRISRAKKKIRLMKGDL